MHKKKLIAGALPSVICVSLLFMFGIMMMIELCLNSGRMIARAEDYEQGRASLHAFRLRYMLDTTINLTNEYKQYELSDKLDFSVHASISKHGLYDKVSLKYDLATGGSLVYTGLAGVIGTPYDCGVIVPSDDGIVTLSDTCSFESNVMFPRGLYRINRYNDDSLVVLKAPSRMPPLTEETYRTADSVLNRAYLADSVCLTDADSIPDRLVAARYVYVDSTFNSSVQIFATDSVTVDSGACLQYPSGIYGYSETCSVKVKCDSRIDGYVIMPSKSAQVCDSISYVQESGSVVRGLIYIDGKAQVSGVVSGTLFLRLPVKEFQQGEMRWAFSKFHQVANYVTAIPNVFNHHKRHMIIKKYEID